ncbi:hypothetical protein EI42_02903 [Thermosporothrix hazakensis]|jgi:hypothetical protein|uniref:Uncharacterized protein n=2 Tax=Thermosporothrix TaxID=768650 RepID=A0A326U6F0_THEHA|nr:hypothetical protein [Thermosporothrix hazakensis]PZW29182.1 hypothetical protein EI42_02903 [Thermosporothrix hazakensis]BBH86109.1 hypothetical protein KTC_08600 [Thermosporothrix sp. COM3]GCE45466.1 hypothetical protein KTH_03350 [Thermosporothrix hazakensis]
MQEREKQKIDQEKKHANEKERRAHPQEDVKKQVKQPHAGMATDPETMKDPGYAKRIEEKTKKH